MNGLVAKICDQLEELTSDLSLYHKPTGGRIPPKVINTFLPQGSRHQEGEDCPSIQVALYKGVIEGRAITYHVLLYGLIYTDGNIQQGTEDMKRLAKAMMRIREKRSFSPFTLQLPATFSFGDQEQNSEAMQPHPYHFFKMYLTFSAPAVNGMTDCTKTE